MSRPRMRGFQKPLNTAGTKAVGLAIVKRNESTDMFVTCSCGWTYGHIREKVREDAVDRHINKRHNGRGIRL